MSNETRHVEYVDQKKKEIMARVERMFMSAFLGAVRDNKKIVVVTRDVTSVITWFEIIFAYEYIPLNDVKTYLQSRVPPGWVVVSHPHTPRFLTIVCDEQVVEAKEWKDDGGPVVDAMIR